jgi:hypothetical protein
MERTQVKEAKQAIVKPKNRSLKADTMDQPRETVRIPASYIGHVSNSHDSTIEPNTRIVK